jgi:hypothetical protein
MRERPDDPTASATNRYATNDGDARAAPYRSEVTGYQRSYQEKPGLRSCDVVRDELGAKTPRKVPVCLLAALENERCALVQMHSRDVDCSAIEDC